MITREIRALGEVWLSTEEVALQLSGRDADAVYVSAKMLRGEIYITAVNPHDRKISVEISLPADLAAARLHELASTAPPVKRNGGKLSVAFEPLQVRLFSSDPAAPNIVAPETILAEVRKQQGQFESSGNLCYFTRGTRLLFSEHYNKDMRVPAHQQCLIDGMLVKYFHGVPNKYMAGEKYLGGISGA